MITSENHDSWYAVRTFNAQEFKVSEYFKKHSLPHFIPLSKSCVKEQDGQVKWRMRPVVHNLIFVRKAFSEEVVRKILQECPFPLSVYKRQDKAQSWCEIADQNIIDLRIICDVSFCEPTFITQKEYDMKVGQCVRVVHGPLKGIQGKLVRKNKKYYIMKSFEMDSQDALGVMISVSRWCCAPCPEEKKKV